MSRANQDKAHFFARIYEWPLRYFVGALIGFIVAGVSVYTIPELPDRLQPVGVFLFLSGWILIIAGSFGSGVEKFVDLRSPTKVQKRIEKISVFLGVALSVISFTVYGIPDQIKKENKSEMATPNQPSD